MVVTGNSLHPPRTQSPKGTALAFGLSVAERGRAGEGKTKRKIEWEWECRCAEGVGAPVEMEMPYLCCFERLILVY